MAVTDQAPAPGAQHGQAAGPETPSAMAAPPSTTVTLRPAARSEPQRRPLVIIRSADLLAVAGALVAAVATTGMLWTQVAPFTGTVGYIMVTWCLFVVIYAVLVSFDENRPTVRDRVSAVVMHSVVAVVAGALVWVIFYTFIRAWPALHHLNFYTQDLHSTRSTDPLTKGGVLHAMVGTLIEVGIAMAVAVPLGLLAAVFLHEVPGRLSRFVRTVVEAMTALPDVIAGLFIYATLVLTFGYSGLAAGCALTVTIIPIICRAGDVVLRLVPGGLTEASYALGSGQWRTVWYVTLPTARSGLATAVILGAARAIGETSPPLLTAGATNFMNVNPLHSPMMSLPLLAYTEIRSQASGFDATRGFGSAAVLLVLVLFLFAIVRVIGGRGAGQLTPRQQRRRAARSGRDMAGYARRAATVHAATGAAEYPGASP